MEKHRASRSLILRLGRAFRVSPTPTPDPPSSALGLPAPWALPRIRFWPEELSKAGQNHPALPRI